MLLLISNSSNFNIQHPSRYDSMPLICGVSRVPKFSVPRGSLSCTPSYFFGGVKACWKQDSIFTNMYSKTYSYMHTYIIVYIYIYDIFIYVILYTHTPHRIKGTFYLMCIFMSHSYYKFLPDKHVFFHSLQQRHVTKAFPWAGDHWNGAIRIALSFHKLCTRDSWAKYLGF